MNEYKVMDGGFIFLNHYVFKPGFYLQFLLKKRINKTVLLFLFCCLAVIQQAVAQDTITDTVAKTATDTTRTENGFDTTGYYFNWKENRNDAYTDKKITARISSDTTVKRLRTEDDFWYVKSVEDFKKNAVRLRTDRTYRDSLVKAGLMPPDEQDFSKESTGNEWYLQPWFNNVIWIIIVAIFVAAVVYFLLSNKINLFTRSVTRNSSNDITTEENLYNTNLDLLLAKYIEEKNYRLAVRVLYLQLLKNLSERNIIVFQPQLTNTNYLHQLANTSLYHDFFTVTRHYEYIWYGEFAISEMTFEKVNSDFANIKKELLRK